MKTVCCPIPSLVCDGGWCFLFVCLFGLPPPPPLLITWTKYLETEFLKPGCGFTVKVNLVKLMEEYCFVTTILQFISVLLLDKSHGKLSGTDCAELLFYLFPLIGFIFVSSLIWNWIYILRKHYMCSFRHILSLPYVSRLCQLVHRQHKSV